MTYIWAWKMFFVWFFSTTLQVLNIFCDPANCRAGMKLLSAWSVTGCHALPGCGGTVSMRHQAAGVLCPCKTRLRGVLCPCTTRLRGYCVYVTPGCGGTVSMCFFPYHQAAGLPHSGGIDQKPAVLLLSKCCVFSH